MAVKTLKPLVTTDPNKTNPILKDRHNNTVQQTFFNTKLLDMNGVVLCMGIMQETNGNTNRQYLKKMLQGIIGASLLSVFYFNRWFRYNTMDGERKGKRIL